MRGYKIQAPDLRSIILLCMAVVDALYRFVFLVGRFSFSCLSPTTRGKAALHSGKFPQRLYIPTSPVVFGRQRKFYKPSHVGYFDHALHYAAQKIVDLFAWVDFTLRQSIPSNRRLLPWIVLTGCVNIHRTSFFEPEEDENILLHIWSTFFIGVMFPFFDELPPNQFFDDAIPEQERKRIMEFYRGRIQRDFFTPQAGKRISCPRTRLLVPTLKR